MLQLTASVRESSPAAPRCDFNILEPYLQRTRIEKLETRAERPGRGGGFYGGDDALTIGAEFIKEAETEIASLARSGRGRVRIQTKATILSSSTGATGMVPTDTRIDPVITPRRRMTVRQLLSPGRTASNAVRFVRLESRSNSAAMHSEGTTKAEQTLGFELDTADVQTVAAWIPASKSILDDAPALQTLIDNELRYAVSYKEEQQLLVGDGTSTSLHGLVPQATAFSAPFSATDTQMLDQLLQAKAQLAAAEIEANGVVMNAVDWSRLLTLKDDEGRYIVPGGPFATTPPVIWGMDVVPTNAMTVDKFMVGDFKRAGTLYDREETIVEVSTDHDDYFVRNLVAIRAEERVALTVTAPECLVYGDFGNVT